MKNKKSRINYKDLLRFFTFYTPGYDRLINISMFILIGFGSLMIASVNVGLGNEIIKIVMKQFAYIIIGYVASCVCNRLFTFSRYHSLQYVLVPVLWILMGLAVTTKPINGSSAWLSVGGFSLQPSELAKPLAILIVADSIYVAKKKVRKNWFELYRFPLISFLVCNVIIVLQKDLGTLFIIDFIYFICVIIPDLSILKKFKRTLTLLFIVGLMAGIGFCALCYYKRDVFQDTPLEYVTTRIHNTFNPYDDLYNDGYQPVNALYGIGDANVIGKGLGNSTRKYGYLTQGDTDYIFALTIEETGIFGLFIIVTCYMILLWRLFYHGSRCQSLCSRIVIVGNIAYIFIHFFLNVGGVACLIPLTGIPLLFFSRGGSSLVSILISMGICQKIISTLGKKNS